MTDVPDPDRRSVSSRILRATFVVFAAHLTMKFLGILQARAVGAYCADVTRDLFVYGLDGVLMTVYLVGEEALGPALLPVFMEEKTKKGESAAWSFAGTVLTLQFALILAAMAAVMIFPVAVTAWLTDWDAAGANPAYMALAPLYARYMILGLLGLGLGSTTYMLLNGYKRFFLAAFGDAAFKLGIIAALLVTGGALGYSIEGMTGVVVFGAGAAAGGVFKLATHLVGLRKELKHLRLGVRWKNPAFRRFLWLVAPLILGIVFAKARDVYNQIYILSHVQEGLLSANAFGRKIYQAIGYLVPYAVSIAMLPFFCEMVDRDHRDELGETVTRSSRLILLMCAPLAALVVALSLPITQILYQQGEFQFQSCVRAATANACYSMVLPFFALEYVFMQTFFANRRMVAVTVMGIGYSALSMIVCYVGVVRWGWSGLDALKVVALAFTVSRILKVFTLGGMMRRFVPCFPVRETASFALRVAAVATGAGVAAWGVRLAYESAVRIPRDMGGFRVIRYIGPELALAGLAGGAAAVGLAWCLCREDSRLVLDWTLARLRRRPPPPQTDG